MEDTFCLRKGTFLSKYVFLMFQTSKKVLALFLISTLGFSLAYKQLSLSLPFLFSGCHSNSN